ncbi:MAG: hypothetical protein H6819_07365 [Phycisphaerales bacterium]|nr:hypothetical protein [Phycisphaerales bacterium]MCB9857687.1 hypothetical protein [Phycisphaerales bacterium]MCB9864776.1 hypothetical protein [Phycisphaerales bacterium]
MDIANWLVSHRLELGIAVVVLLGLLMLQRMWRGIRRRRKPAPLHPKLQPYAGRTDADIASEQVDASRIVATSSTPSIVGYQLIRQIEAVYVEGHRAPNDAVTALKAVAARKGANAIVNLSQSRTAGGRCTAQGDAVVVRPDAGASVRESEEKG